MPIVSPVDSMLVIDVGNTRAGLGVLDGDGLHHTCRVSLDQPEGWQPAIEHCLDALGDGPQAAVIGTVNPAAAARLQALVEELTGLSGHRVRDDLPLPMEVDVDNVDEVGVDRICCAAAAFERLQSACAVASFGTATTVDCVSQQGRFLGGVILPGFEMSCDALHDRTAQLPRVRPGASSGIFAKNTHDAIVNGVTFGAVGALREIVERYATELGEWPQLVITGGNAGIVAELADFVDAVVPDLCLMGVALSYRLAAGQS